MFIKIIIMAGIGPSRAALVVAVAVGGRRLGSARWAGGEYCICMELRGGGG